MAILLAYLIVAVAIGVAQHLGSDDGEHPLSVGLLFPVVALGVAAWLAVEAWDAVREMLRNLD